jgi:hypothetical protein
MESKKEIKEKPEAAEAAKAVPVKNKDPRIDRMYVLEREIEDWRYHNSQSNPGAVMELRSMRKELEGLKKELGLK